MRGICFTSPPIGRSQALNQSTDYARFFIMGASTLNFVPLLCQREDEFLGGAGTAASRLAGLVQPPPAWRGWYSRLPPGGAGTAASHLRHHCGFAGF